LKINKFKQLIFILPLLGILLFGTSCEFKKAKKLTNPKEKLAKAREYFEKEDFNRAMILLEPLVPIFKGQKEGEEVFYKYSHCNYALQDYILAGYYFRKFANTYPTSDLTEDARYMSAYCYYMDAPKSKLDQETTHKALSEFQFFITKYPESDRVQECNETVDQLRIRLEQKAYDNAKLYYDLGYYNAAVVSLKSMLRDFPDSKYREEAYFYIIKAKFDYAENSIVTKRSERYQEAFSACNILIKKFPATEFIKEMEEIKKESSEGIEEFKNYSEQKS